MPHHSSTADWWRQACVYQIYPRSFADADRNGIGDLRGITSRIAHLRALGIDAVCLSPHYSSARTGDGSDADDPREVDLRLGTLEDFDNMVARMHAADIKLMTTLLPDRAADLDWGNSEVRDDFQNTMRFWSDRGVDGFRIEGTSAFWAREDIHAVIGEWRRTLGEYPVPRHAVTAVRADERAPTAAPPTSTGQALTLDLCRVPFAAHAFSAVVRDQLARAAESDSAATWALSHHTTVRHATRYGFPQQSPPDPRSSPDAPLDAAEHWVASRGRTAGPDHAIGLRRARAATLFMLALPGSASLYQGEELGLHEVADIADDERQDPLFFTSAGTRVGRDGCRVALPWTLDGPSYGFGGPTDIPQPEWFKYHAAHVQAGDPDSTLSLYRRAVALRRELHTSESLEWIDCSHPDVVGFRRPNGWYTITNFGSADARLPAALGGHHLLLSSAPRRARGDTAILRGETTAWFRVV